MRRIGSGYVGQWAVKGGFMAICRWCGTLVAHKSKTKKPFPAHLRSEKCRKARAVYSKKMPDETQRTIDLLANFVNGTLTRQEMISGLAELSAEALQRLPPMPVSYPIGATNGVREDALSLQADIAAGKTVAVPG